MNIGQNASPVLVDIRNLSMRFNVATRRFQRKFGKGNTINAVDEVSFHVFRGETLAIVGESGCGKSTLARVLAGLYSATDGEIIFDGRAVPALASARVKSLRRRIQMVFQDPFTSLNPRWRVDDIIAEPMWEHGVGGDSSERGQRVSELLDRVGLSRTDRQKYPHQFSGGQRQRIAIARALSTQPDFLICDEPTSALDVSVQAQVLNLMRELQNTEAGLTYLFISHNLAVVHHFADRIGVMYLGRLIELAPKHQLFAQPLHPYTRMLLDAVPKLKRSAIRRAPIAGEIPNPIDPPSGCAFHTRCPLAQARCRAEIPELRTIEADGFAPVHRVACHALEEGRS